METENDTKEEMIFLRSHTPAIRGKTIKISDLTARKSLGTLSGFEVCWGVESGCSGSYLNLNYN